MMMVQEQQSVHIYDSLDLQCSTRKGHKIEVTAVHALRRQNLWYSKVIITFLFFAERVKEAG